MLLVTRGASEDVRVVARMQPEVPVVSFMQPPLSRLPCAGAIRANGSRAHPHGKRCVRATRTLAR
eukprot:2569907-Prymnesium_polylepis.1